MRVEIWKRGRDVTGGIRTWHSWKNLRNIDRNAQAEDCRETRDADKGQTARPGYPNQIAWPPNVFFPLRGVMTGEEDGERSCAFTILVFPELPLHRGPLFPRHPPYSVFKSIWDGKSSHSRERGTAGRVVHRKEAVLVLRKVEIAFWFNSKKKKKKAHSQNTEQSNKGSSYRGRRVLLTERAIHRRKKAVDGTKVKLQDPCSPET